MPHEPTIAFIMGCTNAGKSTFLNFAAESDPGVKLVEVGKRFREKYPREDFKGRNNPDHTADEASRWLQEWVTEHLAWPYTKLILVDGQPRDYRQVHECVQWWPGIRRRFLMFDCFIKARQARAKARFDSNDPDYRRNIELSQQRQRRDMQDNFVVTIELLKLNQKVEVVDTNRPREEYLAPVVQALLTGGSLEAYSSMIGSC